MGSTIAGVATTLALGFWYLRTRRHPNWRRSPEARFYVTTGYPLTAIAVYWLVQSNRTDWAWTVGNLWTLAAMILFVRGFNALNQPIPDDSPPASADRHVSSHYSDARGITTR
jgi:hypothetical protein